MQPTPWWSIFIADDDNNQSHSVATESASTNSKRQQNRFFFANTPSNTMATHHTTTTMMKKSPSTQSLVSCIRTDTVTCRSICCAVALGFVVLALLVKFVDHVKLPDKPAGTTFAVISIGPFNVIGILLWFSLFVMANRFKPRRLAIASLSASWLIMLFWLVCALICCILTSYFSSKTKLWPHVDLSLSVHTTDHNKNRARQPHSFTELKNAQRASLGSAILSFMAFVLWAVVARYRAQTYVAIRTALENSSFVENGPNEFGNENANRNVGLRERAPQTAETTTTTTATTTQISLTTGATLPHSASQNNISEDDNETVPLQQQQRSQQQQQQNGFSTTENAAANSPNSTHNNDEMDFNATNDTEETATTTQNAVNISNSTSRVFLRTRTISLPISPIRFATSQSISAGNPRYTPLAS